MILSKDIEYICDQYGLGRYLSIDAVTEGVLNDNHVLTTDSGKYFIKSVREKIQSRLPTIYAVEIWMRFKEIPAIAMLMTLSGEIYIKGENALYTVYPYVESDRTHAYSLNDYRNMGLMLGKIHRVGSEEPSASLRVNDFSRPTSEIILERLADFKQKIQSKKQMDDIDREMLEYINFKMKIMPSIEKVSLPNDIVTHGDYQTGNILFDTATRKIIGICDWEKTEFAPRVYELARSLFYICFENKPVLADALETVGEFLSGYRSVYPIDKDELMAGVKMRVEKMALSAWIEDMYYDQHSDRANHFIKNEKRIIELAIEGNLYEALGAIV